jgi:radical SAM superfamily enzyme YgiQ (UPF0313 family)
MAGRVMLVWVRRWKDTVMKELLKCFRESYQILHSYLFSVLIVFFCEGAVINHYFSGAFITRHVQAFLIAGGLVRTFFYSGIFGALVDLCTGEEYRITMGSFWRNVKEVCPVYLLAQAVNLAALFLLFSSGLDLENGLVGFGVDLPVLCLLAFGILWRKAAARGIKTKVLPAIKLFDAAFIIFIWALQLAARVSAPVLGLENHYIAGGILGAEKYLSLLLFVFIVKIYIKRDLSFGEIWKPRQEIFFINPLGGGSFREDLSSLLILYYPYNFLVLEALTPKKYQIRKFCRVFWRKRYYKSNVLVAITSHTCNISAAYKIAKEFRKRGAKVVMGGSHVSCLPEEALAFCDSVVVGEAEGVWEALLADYENNDLKRVYHGAASEAQYNKVHQFFLQAPAEEVVDNLVTTHGCKFNCSFCAVRTINEGRTRCKPVSQVIELIQRFRPKRTYFHFLDSNMFTDPAYAKELFQALIPLKIKWRGCSSLDIAADEDCLRLAKASGCVGLLIGYEINQASPEKKQGGKLKLADQYLEYTRRIKKAGIDVKGHFIFGYDSDRWKDLFDYWKFCFNVFPSHTGFSILTPLPGTRLFAGLLAEARIMNANWQQYTTLQIVFKTRQVDFKKVGIFFPFIMILFYLTTSKNGWFLLVSLICLGSIILKIMTMNTMMF